MGAPFQPGDVVNRASTPAPVWGWLHWLALGLVVGTLLTGAFA